MGQAIYGKKIGMTAVFMEDGRQIPVTVIETAGNKVLGKRTIERDGYTALIVGFGEKKAKRLNKPELGFFEKNGLLDERDGTEYAKRFVREIRMSGEELDTFEIGSDFNATRFINDNDLIDVTGTSKGRGFTGVMRRHNFRGTKASHGVHEYFRHGGSISACTYPARVFKNKKMPGQHGNARITVQSLRVVEVHADDGLVLIKGGVPGSNGSLVRIQHAVKGRRH